MPSSASSADATDAGDPPMSRDRGGPNRRRRVAGLVSALGLVLALAGAWFVARQIIDGWSDYGEVIRNARWWWVALSLPGAVLGMSSMGLVWRWIIDALGGSATRTQVFVWYQLGQLGKYLPGGLWPMVGRSELARRGGLDRATAYNSVALSMGATYLCATLVGAILLPFVILTHGDDAGQLWVFALIPVGLAALHPRLLGPMLRLSERVLGKGAEQQIPPWSTSALLVLRHAVPWLVIGVATWWVALAFDPSAPFLPVVFAGILSWVVGFVVVFVPGGLGVREAAFTAVVSTALRPDIAATVAIVSRLVFVAADAIGALAALPLSRRLAARADS